MLCPIYAFSHVRVGPKNVGAVKFATSSFWGPAAAVAVADGTGVVTFTQCHFDAWDSHLTANGTRCKRRGPPEKNRKKKRKPPIPPPHVVYRVAYG